MNFTREQVVTILKQKVCSIRFEKVSGEVSEAKFTLVEGELPPSDSSKAKKAPSNSTTLVTAWNVDKKAWRCFHADKIIGPIEVLH